MVGFAFEIFRCPSVVSQYTIIHTRVFVLVLVGKGGRGGGEEERSTGGKGRAGPFPPSWRPILIPASFVQELIQNVPLYPVILVDFLVSEACSRLVEICV